MANLSASFRALGYRNYRLFFSGQLISLIGTWMQTVAQAWLVYRLTGKASMLGLVAFASQFPIFLMAPLGGAAADRVRCQRLLVATQTSSMILTFALALLILLNRVHLWHIFTTSILLGIVNAFDIPGRQVFVAETVERKDLMNAIALNSSMFNGARIVGPAVAGVLLAAFGEGWCFMINSLSFIAVIWGLLLMRVPDRLARPTPAEPGAKHILEGFSFAARALPIRSLLLLLGLVSLLGMPYSVLMPIFADQILHAGAKGLGFLMGASGVGALLGAFTLAMRPNARGLGAWVAAASIAFGTGLAAFAYSRVYWLSVLLMLPVGYAFMVQMASSNTLIQMMVPDALRGRIMSVYSMMFMGMAPVGALLAGILAHAIGAPGTVALGGAFCVLGGLAFASHLGKWRLQARDLYRAQEAQAGPSS